jgi:polyhydroxyalkanoate synthase
MPRLKITPATLRDEFRELSQTMAAAAGTLRDARDAQIGSCEREVVHRLDGLVLYHYKPLRALRETAPLLIVYALVNRPEMVDLQADRSLMRSLLARGLDIYLIDWGYPDGADRDLGLEDYIGRYIDRCVDVVAERAGVEKVNLFGICQGGTFSTCYSALHPGKVRNLITTVTPIDFHTSDDMLSHLFRYVDVDALTDASGNLSGDLLNMVFLSLKPFRLAQQKYIHMLDTLDDADAMRMFMRMEKWIFDSPALAGRAFREFAREFYQRNGLVKNAITIGKRRVELGRLTMPVLNIYAENDHLVPPAASLALGQHVGTGDYTALGFPGGHIGLYVSTRAHEILPQAIDEWLSKR